ncbi:hypothetical protein HGA88_01225 [Candidatus Roizmanbacteria bacterium]|nr:hypothetical protein [Candidatus Roizmanbacteria bacterium]
MNMKLFLKKPIVKKAVHLKVVTKEFSAFANKEFQQLSQKRLALPMQLYHL